MKGLILKDIYVFGKSMRGYIGVIVFFFAGAFCRREVGVYVPVCLHDGGGYGAKLDLAGRKK